MKILWRYAVIVYVWLMATPLLASDHDAWYQIEVFIFANTDPSAIYEEEWPSLLGPESRSPVIMLSRPLASSNEFERALVSAQPYTMMPAHTHELAAAELAISRQTDFRLLFHEVWQQPLKSQREALDIAIVGGECMDDRCELEGILRFSRERYLHIDTDLWLTHSRFHDSDVATVMQQHRTIRDGELHYMDHPLMGLLVKMTRLPAYPPTPDDMPTPH